MWHSRPPAGRRRRWPALFRRALHQRWVEHIGAARLATRQDMALHRLHHCRSVDLAAELEARHVKRIDLEMIVMRDAVVPGRARAVIAAVVALHLRVAGEPFGVVVD